MSSKSSLKEREEQKLTKWKFCLVRLRLRILSPQWKITDVFISNDLARWQAFTDITCSLKDTSFCDFFWKQWNSSANFSFHIQFPNLLLLFNIIFLKNLLSCILEIWKWNNVTKMFFLEYFFYTEKSVIMALWNIFLKCKWIR